MEQTNYTFTRFKNNKKIVKLYYNIIYIIIINYYCFVKIIEYVTQICSKPTDL